MADTPTRLVGAEFEIGKWIWVDHKRTHFVHYRITAWRFESSPDSNKKAGINPAPFNFYLMIKQLIF